MSDHRTTKRARTRKRFRESTRRQFLKGLTTGTVAIGALTQSGCAPAIPPLKTRGATETTTVCPFCGVGCGQVVVDPRRQGNPHRGRSRPSDQRRHVVQQGSFGHPGGEQLAALAKSSLPQNRAAKAWEEKSWDWALERIAARVKETRDKSFKTKVNENIVNRTEAIACLGGSALDNEEAYLLVKLMRALGLVYVEHQARL